MATHVGKPTSTLLLLFSFILALGFLLPSVNATCSASANTFLVAGSNSVIVPTGCNIAEVQLWGASGYGSGGNGASGGGGYISGNIATTAGNTLQIFIGGGGSSSTNSINGGGAPGTAGGGGGCSAIGTSTGTWGSVSVDANILLVAGGGGGAGNLYAGGAAGGHAGTGGGGNGGGGGSQTSGGSAGAAGATTGNYFYGNSIVGGTGYYGSSNGGGGGGCGYYGGGGGAGNVAGGGGGGGGSSWNSITITSITNLGGSGINPGGNTVSNYPANVGLGYHSGGNPSNPGAVIISWAYYSYTSPTITQPTVSNSVVDQNQYESFNGILTGGTGPFNIFIYVANSANPSNIVYSTNAVFSGTSWSFNGIQVTGNWVTNSPIVANAIGYDIGNSNYEFNSVVTSTIPVSSPLVSTAMTASNSILDPTQYDQFTANINGGSVGISGYTYNFLAFNAMGTQIGNYLITTTATSVTWNYQLVSPFGGADKANVVITDSASTNAMVTNSIGFTADNALIPSIVPSSATIDNGQSITLTGSYTGGHGTISYQWYGSSGCSASPLGTLSTQSVSPTSTTTYCLKVTDQASSPNSNTITSVITVNSAQVANVLTLSNTIIDNGQLSIGTAGATGGTPGYTFVWYSQAGCAGSSFASSTPVTLTPSSTTTYSFTSTDNAYNPNTICSASNTITVNPALSITSWTALHSVVYTAISESQTLNAIISGGTPGSGYTYTYNIYNAIGLCRSQVYTTTMTSNTYTYIPGTGTCGLGTITANIIVTDAASTPTSQTSSLTYIAQSSPILNSPLSGNTIYVPLGGTNTITLSGPTGDLIAIEYQGVPLAEGYNSISYLFSSPYTSLINKYYITFNDITAGDPNSGNIVIYNPLTFMNTTNTIQYPGANYMTANYFTTYYPFLLSANSFPSGTYNLNYTFTPPHYTVSNPTSLTSVYTTAQYTSNTALTSNIIAYDVFINPGVYITTGPYAIIAYNAIWGPSGGIITGAQSNGGAGGAPGNAGTAGTGSSLSFGATGGGGGGGTLCSGPSGGTGGANLASGGNGGGCTSGGGNGNTYTSPTLNNANILTWYNGGISNYLSGSGGGGGGSNSGSGNTGGSGGNGGYGCLLQANVINLGSVNTKGTVGSNSAQGSGGGGGSGVCVEAYGTSFSLTTNTVSGAAGGTGGESGGAGGAGASLSYHWATQPIPISTPSTSFTINALTGVANYSYILPANSISGNYLFQTKLIQNSNSIVLNASVTVNMTDVKSLTYGGVCSPTIQYFPNCANATFSLVPTSWEIVSDLPANRHLNQTHGDTWSNANITLVPKVLLNYGSPVWSSFIANVTNNPAITIITQNTYNYSTFNTIQSGGRLIGNVFVFSQLTFNGLVAPVTAAINATFNNYTIARQFSMSTSSDYYIYISESTYVNPTIVYILNASTTIPLYYSQYDTYCTATLNNTQYANFPMGLVDTNGTKVQFYITTATGQSVPGYILQIFEQHGVSSMQVQSYKIPGGLSFYLPLEGAGQQYAFKVYNPPCTKVVAQTGFSAAASPTYITINSSGAGYIIKKSNAIGSCKVLGSNSIVYNMQCKANDNTNETFKYQLIVSNITSIVGTSQQVVNQNFSAHSFLYNFTEPINRSYTYTIYGYAYNTTDPATVVNSGPLTFGKAPISTPLLGLIAFLLLLVLIFGGLATGKVSILMLFVDLGMIAVNVFGLLQIPPIVVVVFGVISAILIWWEKK